MSLELSIRKHYSDFTLEEEALFQGNRIGILGASGSGKSMTLKSIAGICTPDEGRIVLNGNILFDSEKRINIKPQKRRVGYLFQNYALFPKMTVEQNIAAGIRRTGEEKRRQAAELLERFQLDGLERRYPAELSGGQQQRVALARIMASGPDVLLLDEPFSALDMYLKDHMQHELELILKEYRGLMVLVSHNRDEIYRFSTETAVMEAGRVTRLDQTREVFRNPLKKEAARLTGCKNISRIKRLDCHHIRALDWGIDLYSGEAVGEQIRSVGIRAHELLPCWDGPGRNRIPLRINSVVELPFEKQFYLAPVPQPWLSDHAAELSWFVQKEKWERLETQGKPSYVELPSDKLLLLQS